MNREEIEKHTKKEIEEMNEGLISKQNRLFRKYNEKIEAWRERFDGISIEEMMLCSGYSNDILLEQKLQNKPDSYANYDTDLNGKISEANIELKKIMKKRIYLQPMGHIKSSHIKEKQIDIYQNNLKSFEENRRVLSNLYNEIRTFASKESMRRREKKAEPLLNELRECHEIQSRRNKKEYEKRVKKNEIQEEMWKQGLFEDIEESFIKRKIKEDGWKGYKIRDTSNKYKGIFIVRHKYKKSDSQPYLLLDIEGKMAEINLEAKLGDFIGTDFSSLQQSYSGDMHYRISGKIEEIIEMILAKSDATESYDTRVGRVCFMQPKTNYKSIRAMNKLKSSMENVEKHSKVAIDNLIITSENEEITTFVENERKHIYSNAEMNIEIIGVEGQTKLENGIYQYMTIDKILIY